MWTYTLQILLYKQEQNNFFDNIITIGFFVRNNFFCCL